MYNSVLLVDDDPIQIALLTSYFKSLNVEHIHSATDPTKALGMLTELASTLELIVSDLQMPNMDGIEFMRHLKGYDYNGSFALISGVQTSLLGHAARLATMQNLKLIGHISKPLKKEELDAVFLFSEELAVPTEAQDNVIITHADFASAMHDNEIFPYYQPKIDVRTGRVTGSEALARWFRKDGTFISPEKFIAFAEANGRIGELTFYLFDKVLKDIPAFLDVSPDCTVAFNLAPDNIRSMALPDQLYDRMKRAGLTAKNISLEVTENSVLNLDLTTLEVLSRLRVLDFDVAIDDFVTGFSNIQMIRDFPYSELKIDKSFIANAISDPFSQETVRAAVSLAHQQGMSVVAEGVEDMETWEMLNTIGIEHAQGYLMAKPMPAANFVEFLKEHSAGLKLSAA